MVLKWSKFKKLTNKFFGFYELIIENFLIKLLSIHAYYFL